MTDELLKEKDMASTANEVLLKKVEVLNTENGELGLENATLKVRDRRFVVLDYCIHFFFFFCRILHGDKKANMS